MLQVVPEPKTACGHEMLAEQLVSAESGPIKPRSCSWLPICCAVVFPNCSTRGAPAAQGNFQHPPDVSFGVDLLQGQKIT